MRITPTLADDSPMGGAMLRSLALLIARPGYDETYSIGIDGTGKMSFPFRRVLEPLDEEETVLQEHLDGFNKKGEFKVLVIGCGVGRHLNYVHENFENARLWGSESNAALRAYCHEHYGATMLATVEEIQETDFSVILLLGGNIGQYGTAERLQIGLNSIHRMLTDGGLLIGECGRLFNTPDFDPAQPELPGYSEKMVTATLNGTAATFPWLFCRWRWLRNKLKTENDYGFRFVDKKNIGIIEAGEFLFVVEERKANPRVGGYGLDDDGVGAPGILGNPSWDVERYDPVMESSALWTWRDNIFDFSPNHCEALALWVIDGQVEPIQVRNRWTQLMHEFHGVKELLWGGHWQEINNIAELPPGSLIRLTPPLDMLRYIYIMPNMEPQNYANQEHIRHTLMLTLELLHNRGIKSVAINRIRSVDNELISDMLKNTINAWFANPAHGMGPEDRIPNLLDVHLTDLSGNKASASIDTHAWHNRPLGVCPYLVLYARHEQIYHGGQVVNTTVLVAVCIDQEGNRKVLGVSVSPADAENSWLNFLHSLNQRGMAGVLFIVSDDHPGLHAARMACLPNVPWQRCQFHLTQEAQSFFPQDAQQSAQVGRDIQAVFAAPNHADAIWRLARTVNKYMPISPQCANWMEQNLPQGLTVFMLPAAHRRRMCASKDWEYASYKFNLVICPDDKTLLRFITTRMIETNEQYKTEGIYLDFRTEAEQQQARLLALQQHELSRQEHERFLEDFG